MINSFIAMSDLHIDSPFSYLNEESLIEKMKNNLLKILKNVFLKINEENRLCLISGDLFDGEIADFSTITYLDELFSLANNVTFLIIAGNHDLENNNTLLYDYNFKAKNVIILNDSSNMYEIENIRVYSKLKENQILDKSFYNILMWHGDFASKGLINPLPEKYKNIGFNYIALGHIHKYENHSNINTLIYYPGSLFARGFDETSKHGYLEVSLKDNKVDFKEVIQNEYININIDISNIDSNAFVTIASMIKEKIDNPNNLYRIILKGSKNNLNKINLNYLYNELEGYAFYLKIIDKTIYKTEKKESKLEKMIDEKINKLIENDISNKDKYLRALKLSKMFINHVEVNDEAN